MQTIQICRWWPKPPDANPNSKNQISKPNSRGRVQIGIWVWSLEFEIWTLAFFTSVLHIRERFAWHIGHKKPPSRPRDYRSSQIDDSAERPVRCLDPRVAEPLRSEACLGSWRRPTC